MSEIITITDERERKITKTETNKGDGSYSEKGERYMILLRVRLGFLQLICKASLIFKSNFELALTIILKDKELYESKHVA